MNGLVKLTAVGLLVVSQTVLAQDWFAPKLPFKNAVVEYQVTGMSAGTKTTYIRDYGRESAEYTNLSMKMMGMVQTQQEIDITTRDWVYSVDMNSRTATKMMNPEKVYRQELEKYSSTEQDKIATNAEKFGMNSLQGMGGTLTKNAAKLQGYSCDLTEMSGIKVYSISETGFPLKVETNMMGMKSTEEAVSIKKVSPPADKFSLPAGVTVEHDQMAENMMRNHIRQTLSSLVAGEMPKLDSDGYDAQGAEMNSGEEALSPEAMQQLQQMMQQFGQ